MAMLVAVYDLHAYVTGEKNDLDWPWRRRTFVEGHGSLCWVQSDKEHQIHQRQCACYPHEPLWRV